MNTLQAILTFFFIARIFSLIISIINERKLKKQRAIQYGKVNSFFLSLTHVIFYISAFYEANSYTGFFNIYSEIGLYFMIFSYIMLFYIIYELREIWTVKIYIAPNHKIVRSFLFRTIRHPNYFLNVIPELIGVGLLCNAWNSLLFILPFYSILLIIRIIQEEKAMKQIA